jgi:hypothetical protein
VGERALHCWKDEREHLADVHGWGTDAYWNAWALTWDGDVSLDGTCMLEAGHDGPHEFTPDSDIGVTFAPAEARGG